MTRKTILIGWLVALLLVGAGFAAGTLATHGIKAANPPSTVGSGPIAPITPTAPVTLAPDLTGLNLSRAVQVLRSMGLGVGGLTARQNPLDLGVVLSQGAPPGSRVSIGQEVRLVLSAGPLPFPVMVGGEARVGVGGTCELLWPQPSRGCVGGPLVVPYEGS